MILPFFYSHVVFCNSEFSCNGAIEPKNVLSFIPLLAATFLFFFKLRVFDEIKDFDHDSFFNSQRPLPRGLITADSALTMVLLLILLEIVILSFYGLWALIAMVITVAYSFLMYKEFFCGNWLRSHITTYAVTHTLIIILFSTTIFLAFLDISPAFLPSNFIIFSIASWFIFNIFELGRKTFANNEEVAGVNSYSKRFGTTGAVLLVILMALAGVFLYVSIIDVVALFVILLLLLVSTGVLFIVLDNQNLAKFYRKFTSLYVIFSYAIIIVSILYF